MTKQLKLPLEGYDAQVSNPLNTSSTFADNMKLPVHRWFRYSAGFSAMWVESLITQAMKQGNVTLLDPFAGSGTTLLVSEKLGAQCYGIEAHPFVARVASCLNILLWNGHPCPSLKY